MTSIVFHGSKGASKGTLSTCDYTVVAMSQLRIPQALALTTQASEHTESICYVCEPEVVAGESQEEYISQNRNRANPESVWHMEHDRLLVDEIGRAFDESLAPNLDRIVDLFIQAVTNQPDRGEHRCSQIFLG